MSDYTPNTEQVATTYGALRANRLDARDEFDRWLAADRKAQRAEAWQHCVDFAASTGTNDDIRAHLEFVEFQNPYRGDQSP